MIGKIFKPIFLVSFFNVLATSAVAQRINGVAAGGGDPRISGLAAEPGFRELELRWQAAPTKPNRFLIKYCEYQVWGEHRCRYRVFIKYCVFP